MDLLQGIFLIVLYILILSLSAGYALLMSIYILGWRLLPKGRVGQRSSLFVSILIPTRNEAQNISACLESIVQNDFPQEQFEIIVLDDDSEDDTVHQVETFKQQNFQLALHCVATNKVEMPTSGKKAALTLGIQLAKGEIILTTDADCIAGPDWIRLMLDALESGRMLVTGPVQFHREKNALERFQSLDILGMMGITGAGLHLGFQRMANGANMAYFKSAFLDVEGYKGNEDQASGDDMFLIQKMEARFPGSVGFVKNKDASVWTEAMPSLKTFVQQRLRWGAKNKGLSEWPIRLALLLVFLFCWSILMTFFALAVKWLMNGVWDPALGNLLVIHLILKAVADFTLLLMMCRFFGRLDLLPAFPLSFILHTAYIAFIGLAGLLTTRYTWKKRVFMK